MMLRFMTVTGSLLNHLGEFTSCEQCYSLYIAIIEVIEGNNSVEVAHCYFWLGQFYSEDQISSFKEDQTVMSKPNTVDSLSKQLTHIKDLNG